MSIDLIAQPAFRIPTYTWAGKPATYPEGQQVKITTAGAKGFWHYESSRWKPVNNRLLIGSFETPSGNIGSAVTAVLQQAGPAALLQVGDRLEVRLSESRSGTVDVARWSLYVGSAVTTADTAVVSDAALISSTNLNAGFLADFKVVAATSLEQLGSAVFGYGAAATNTTPSPIAIPNVSGALGFTIGVRSSGTANTVIGRDGQVWLVAPST